MSFDVPTLVSRLSRGRVLVVGDVILDRHVRGRVERVSPEAPIQILSLGAGTQHEEDSPGGAANVACKIAELGGQAILAGVVGGRDDSPDEDGRKLIKATEAFGVVCSPCLSDPERPTTLKIRYMARDHQLLRVDRESRAPVSGDAARRLARAIERELPRCDAVIVEDYGKGALAPKVLAAALSRAGDLPVVVDPNGADWSRYRGAAVITPNAREVEFAARREARDVGELVELARQLIDEAGARAIAITRGAEGMTIVTKDACETVPTVPVEVYDVTGAGDAVAAVFALALAGGLTLGESAAVANVAGRLVVQQVGVGHVSRDQLVHPKLVSRDQAAAVAKRMKASAKSVVFTNGCFDLLHPGHIRLFEEARSKGHFLIVGLNSDESARRLKGPTRPILSEQERLQLIGALSSVDLITFFGDEEDDDRPMRLIEALRPDVLVKGGEYEESQVVGAKFVRGYGGDVALVPLVEGVSTSSILERVKQREGAERPSRREWRDE